MQASALQWGGGVFLPLENEPNDRFISLPLKIMAEPFLLNL